MLERYDLICLADDDTVVGDDFVAETTKAFGPGVAVVCAKTASDWVRPSGGTPSSVPAPSPT